MEYVQLTLDDWLQMKQRLKQELLGVKQSFVRIGYALRQIEDQKLYERDGYTSIAEFAQTEYGLGASITSRFMSINKEYSIDGYSEHLRPEYAELGRSQLEEMLKLPDTDRQMIQPETQREDIRELKRFNKSEPAAGIADDISQLIEKFYQDNEPILNAVYKEDFTEQTINRFAEIVNPAGNRSYKKGLYFMMMYENRVAFKKFGDTPKDMTWWEFYQITRNIFDESAAGDQTWQKYFGTPEEASEKQKENDLSGEQEEAKIGEIAPAQNAAPILEIKEKSETGSAENPLNTLENATPFLEIKEKHETESATNALNTLKNTAPILEIQEKHDAESATNPLNTLENAAPILEIQEKHETENAENPLNTLSTPAPFLEIQEKDDIENAETAENQIAPAQKYQESPKNLEENGIRKEEKQDTEIVEAAFGTRKEYMDQLTTREMAEYLAEEYKSRRLRVPDLAYPNNLYAWLTEKVDRFGHPIEET